MGHEDYTKFIGVGQRPVANSCKYGYEISSFLQNGEFPD
jgi:hypothetical protein